MRKIFLILILSAFSISLQAQKISNGKWTDLFSYNNILAIRQDGNKLIAATENGVFYYDVNSGEITKLSKANGLHEVKISAFDYNPETHIGLIGYQSGRLDVISPEGVLIVVDIPNAIGFNGEKKINHISITGNKAVVSVAYGVSVFDLDRKEFGDTCFFMENGEYTDARESIIKDNSVFTITKNGLYTHEINTTFSIFKGWPKVKVGDFTQLANHDNHMFVSTTNEAFYGDGTNFYPVNENFGVGIVITDIIVGAQNVIISAADSVRIFDFSGNVITLKGYGENIKTGLFYNNEVFAGTEFSGIKNENGNLIKPDGPYKNESYKMDLYQGKMVVSTGGRSNYSSQSVRDLGYYYFDGSSWHYPQYFLDNPDRFNVLDAIIDRNNPNQIFFTSYYNVPANKGIFKMENDQFVKQYQNDYVDYQNMPVGLTYDENKNLFVSVALYEGNNIGFYYYNAASDKFEAKNIVASLGAQKPFAKDGILYIPTPYINGGGLIIYDYNNTVSTFSDDRFKVIRKDNNLPIDGTVSAAIDNNDNLWIGTRLGLRVLSSPIAALSEDLPQTEPIVIEENGLGEELFRDAIVLQITVDSGNNKWVSIDGGGVFYLSASGDETYQHFTRENSPLPTNSVTDIKFDDKTGKIYFVTLDGIVVYQSDVVGVSENFGDVLVYPNPVVYANYKGNVKIRGLATKTNIRITDAAGNLIHQAVANGGFYEWNLANQRGVRVASGIYFVLMTNADGTDTATAKIAVVN